MINYNEGSVLLTCSMIFFFFISVFIRTGLCSSLTWENYKHIDCFHLVEVKKKKKKEERQLCCDRLLKIPLG